MKEHQEENIRQMDKNQQKKWLRRKMKQYKKQLPSKQLISKKELKKRLFSDIDSYLPDEDKNNSKKKKQKLSYDELVDTQFSDYLNKLTQELTQEQQPQKKQKLSASTTRDEVSEDEEDESEDNQQQQTNNATNADSDVKLRRERYLEQKIRILPPDMKFYDPHGKVLDYVARASIKTHWSFGKIKLFREDGPPTWVEKIEHAIKHEEKYVVPDLTIEQNLLDLPSVLVTFDQYLNAPEIQSLLQQDKNTLTDAEYLIVQLASYYKNEFAMNTTGNKNINISDLWNKFHQALLDGGLQQILQGQMNAFLFVFIFYSFMKGTDQGKKSEAYTNVVLECSKLIFVHSIYEAIQIEKDGNAQSIGISNQLERIDTAGSQLANHLTITHLKILLATSISLITSGYRADIMSFIVYRLLTIAEKTVFDPVNMQYDALAAVFHVFNAYNLVRGLPITGAVEDKLLQKLEQVATDAVKSIFAKLAGFTGTFISNREFIKEKKQSLRQRFLNEDQGIVFSFLRLLKKQIEVNPHLLVPFTESVCDVFYKDIKFSTKTGNQSTFNERNASDINSWQMKLLMSLCRIIDSGIYKFNSSQKNKTDSEMIHIVLLKKVFHFIAQKQTISDDVVRVYIRDTILPATVLRLAFQSFEECRNNTLWPQILELLTDTIQVRFELFFDVLQYYFLALLQLGSDQIEDLVDPVTSSLRVVFDRIFLHRYMISATEKYYEAVDSFCTKTSSIEDIQYSLLQLPEIKLYFKQGIQLLSTTQIVQYFEMVIKNVQSRIEVEDILTKSLNLELLLMPLVTFAFQVVINEANFRPLQNLAKQVARSIVAPLMEYSLNTINQGSDDKTFHEVLKLHYALTVLIKRTTEFSSDVYTYKPVNIDKSADGEDYFIDFRLETDQMEVDSENNSNTINGYRMSDIAGLTLRKLFKKLSYSSRALLCYLLFQRVGLFYQQTMILKSNNLNIEEQKNQNNSEVLQFMEKNLSHYLTFLNHELFKSMKKHSASTTAWNGEVSQVTSVEKYIVMLWFLLTRNLSQFIQFLQDDDLLVVFKFMINQMEAEPDYGQILSKNEHNLRTATESVWNNRSLEWLDVDKNRQLFFTIFYERLKKDIKSIQKDKNVTRILKKIKNGLSPIDTEKEMANLEKKGVKIYKSEIANYLARVPLQEAIHKLFKKSKDKGHKKSSILQGSDENGVKPFGRSLGYIPLMLQLPRDVSHGFFDAKQNYALSALLITLERVLHLNGLYAQDIPLSNYLQFWFTSIVNHSTNPGLFFSKDSFCSQLQTFNPEQQPTLELQSLLLTSLFGTPLTQNDAHEALRLVFNKYQNDNEEQAQNRLIVVTNIMQKLLEKFNYSNNAKLAKRIIPGLFYEENKSTPSFLDYELHWLRVLSAKQQSTELQLSDIQVLHVSQVILMILHLCRHGKFHSDLDQDVWATLIHLCEKRIQQIQTTQEVLSPELIKFVANMVIAVSLFTQQIEDKLRHLTLPLFALLEPVWAALIHVVKLKPDASYLLDDAVKAASFVQLNSVIEYVKKHLVVVAAGRTSSKESSYEIAAYTATLRAIIRNNSNVRAVYTNTILNILRECIVAFRAIPRDSESDWLLDVITLTSELLAGSATDFHYKSVSNIMIDTVMLLKTDSANYYKRLSNSDPHKSWSIFAIVCDTVTQLNSVYGYMQYGGYQITLMLKTLLTILLEQHYAKRISGTDDLNLYMEDLQTCCEKLKVLYNSCSRISERKIDQIIYDIVSTIASLPKSKFDVGKIRAAVIAALVDADPSTVDDVDPITTLVQLSLYTPNFKDVACRLNNRPEALKVFGELCTRLDKQNSASNK
jgi:hypothetical protein